VGRELKKWYKIPCFNPASVPWPAERSTFSYSSITESQVTDSEVHPWRSRKVGSLKDIGGDFFTQRKYPVLRPVNGSYVTDTGWDDCQSLLTRWNGPIWPGTLRGVIPPYPPAMNSSVSELDQLGAKAIAVCAPGKPSVSLPNMFGELLRDGIPHRVGANLEETTLKARKGVQDQLSAGKSVGEEYLNLLFGWTPLISDLTKFAQGAVEAYDKLAQYERDAGRPVRRRLNLPTRQEVLSVSETSPASGGFYSQRDYPGNKTAAGLDKTCVTVRTITQQRWFSGAFIYFLPSGYDSRSALDGLTLYAREILGLELTPEVIWNLTPWTWAVDWFSNFGDVFSTLSRVTGEQLVVLYGYMMEHTIVKDTYTKKNPGNVFIGTSSGVGSIDLITETKMRRRANPFGFGLTWDGLSPYQLSVLAALGITRGSQKGL